MSILQRTTSYPVFLLLLILTGCGPFDGDSNNISGGGVAPSGGTASFTPGVNPAFDSVTEVAMSDTAGGAYTPLATPDSSYDAASESITLGDGIVGTGGAYVRITGDATVSGVTSSYTLYTYVASNATDTAANELTSIAVGHVAEGTVADFGAGIDEVGADTGVTSGSITEPATEADRDPALRASMMAASNQFVDGAFVPGTTPASDATDAIGSCIALGGVAYDNWTKLNAGGNDTLPAAEPNKDYLRCKACHGWDQLATDGGYTRRSRKDTRPNAGYLDPNTVSRVISTDSTFGQHASITGDMILHAGTGRSWGEGTNAFDSTSPWGPGASKGNEHPDLSPTGVNAGDVLPTEEQVRCLASFLNHPEARANKVFAAIKINAGPSDPVPDWCTSAQCVEYTLVATADAARGDAWYHDPSGGNCVTCHGEPEDEMGPIADGPEGGLLAFLRNDGKYSEFRHKVHWGESGNDLMTRENMNNPTAADVADVLAYLQQKVEAPPPVDLTCIALGGVAYDNWTKLNAGGNDTLPAAEPNKDYLRCKACHGWDQLATDGGYTRRSRKDTRPNAGYLDPNTVSRVISTDPTFGQHASITEDMILHAGTGRSWGEGTNAFDSISPWGPGASKGNEHPDLSPTGVNAGDVLPTDEQVRCLTEFLNYAEARADAVFADIKTNGPSDPVPDWCTSAQCVEYTLVATADTARGDAWYHDPNGGNCVTCHGEPEDEMGPIADGPEGGLLAFLRNDGKYSEFRHKVHWGESGNDLMTRENMNNPTAADVADVLAYLQQKIDAQVTGRPTANDDTAATDQDVSVDIDVLANDSDPNGDTLMVTAFDAASAQGGTVNCTAAGVCTYQPPSGFTGTDTFTYEASDGTGTDNATVTITVSSSAPVGDPAAGQARYDSECNICHAAGSHDTTTALGGNDIGGRGTELINTGKLVNNLQDTNATMAGITLTDQEILDMAAFLDSL